jgi:outer membrane lipoprotein-sorting protein
MRKFNLSILIGIFIMVVTACGQNRLTSFEQMMDNMLEYRMQAEIPESYYLESVTFNYESEKRVNQERTKHWYEYKTGRERIETSSEDGNVQYSVFDGKERIVYSDGAKKAVVMKPQQDTLSTPESMIDNIIGMLQQLSSTHTIDIAGEEIIEDEETYHLKLNSKDQNAISGDMEIWINQKTWMIQKLIRVFGNEKQETIFTAYQANPENIEKMLSLELPKGVEVVRDEDQTNIVSLEDIKKILNQSFYYYPETETVRWLPVEQQNDMISLSYVKENGLTYFTVFMKKAKDEILTGDYEIRGNVANLTKSDGLGYTLSWMEEGIQYTIIDLANVLKKEEIFEIADKMKKL